MAMTLLNCGLLGRGTLRYRVSYRSRVRRMSASKRRCYKIVLYWTSVCTVRRLGCYAWVRAVKRWRASIRLRFKLSKQLNCVSKRLRCKLTTKRNLCVCLRICLGDGFMI